MLTALSSSIRKNARSVIELDFKEVESSARAHTVRGRLVAVPNRHAPRRKRTADPDLTRALKDPAKDWVASTGHLKDAHILLAGILLLALDK
jgi:hypothetical protein